MNYQEQANNLEAEALKLLGSASGPDLLDLIPKVESLRRQAVVLREKADMDDNDIFTLEHEVVTDEKIDPQVIANLFEVNTFKAFINRLQKLSAEQENNTAFDDSSADPSDEGAKQARVAKAKGDLFEAFCETFFKIHDSSFDLWGLHNYEAGDADIDFGVDAWAINNEGQKSAIQIKYRTEFIVLRDKVTGEPILDKDGNQQMVPAKLGMNQDHLSGFVTSAALTYGIDGYVEPEQTPRLYIVTNIQPQCRKEPSSSIMVRGWDTYQGNVKRIQVITGREISALTDNNVGFWRRAKRMILDY